MRLTVALSVLVLTACGGAERIPSDPAVTDRALQSELDEAVALYRRVAAERLVAATDPNERTVGSRPLFEKLLTAERYDDLFLLGDAAFEQSASARLGAGSGRTSGGPPRTRRVHDGELGGFDADSCRSCHFGGGPDGGGTASQVTFFRGDGLDVDSAIRRDAPHVMGLGYIQLAARQLERGLARIASNARALAKERDRPVSLPLAVDGIEFGLLTALPDGRLNTDNVDGVSPDLLVRPFGHKGRYRDLVALSEDGLQHHFGIQSPGRLARHAGNALTHLGDGQPWDRDRDGHEQEVPAEHALLLAAYLAMLPVPQMRPPQDPAVQQAWARGQATFDRIGCARCHRPSFRLDSLSLTLADDPAVILDLARSGQEPRPRRTDLSPTPDGRIPQGVPIFAYTDFKRHDMGEALADEVDETLPEGQGQSVSRRRWLTRPLWGVADTPPYLHDGRAATLREAIEWHGGAAAPAATAFADLPRPEQGELLAFLASLTRHPTLLVE